MAPRNASPSGFERTLVVVVGVAALFLALCGVWWRFARRGPSPPPKKPASTPTSASAPDPAGGKVCTAGGGCSGNPELAPVMEAWFNGVQIIKQSLLLEDHLNNVELRCPDCIVKHILTIVALAEEAVSLADNKDDERFMQDASKFYNGILKRIRGKQEDECAIAGDLRAMRKKMMARYMDT